MSKTDAAEAAFLSLVLAGKTYTGVGTVTTSTSIWISLHEADPGDAGTQATSEAAYTGYARIATDRTTGANGWTVTSGTGSASPNSAITFGTCSASSTTIISHFSVGLSSSGAGTAIYNGTVTPNITVTTNVTPSLTTASAITEA